MRRREFISLLGGAAAWPLAARAQQTERMPRIGVLMPYAENDPEAAPRVTALRNGLQQLGWTEGRNVRIEHRWSASDADSMRMLAGELVDLRPAVILTDTTPVTAAVLRETRTIPVIFVQVTDPVGSGFVTSFPRPNGNTTGFTTVPLTMASKWLELLMEVVPRTVRVMCLFDPPTSALNAQRFFQRLEVAASAIGVEPVASPVHDPAEVEMAIAAFAREPDSGLIVLPSVFMLAHRDLVTALAA
jgi:putative tryptophan/tyrosine transport system substrate-binding protein